MSRWEGWGGKGSRGKQDSGVDSCCSPVNSSSIKYPDLQEQLQQDMKVQQQQVLATTRIMAAVVAAAGSVSV